MQTKPSLRPNWTVGIVSSVFGGKAHWRGHFHITSSDRNLPARIEGDGGLDNVTTYEESFQRERGHFRNGCSQNERYISAPLNLLGNANQKSCANVLLRLFERTGPRV